MTENEMVGWYHRLSGHEFEQAPGVGDGGLECCSPWGHSWTQLELMAEIKTTLQINYTSKILKKKLSSKP